MRYSSTAKSWLEKWDRGDIVWSIEMGGLGPNYELVIQALVAEIIREILSGDYRTEEWLSDDGLWGVDSKRISAAVCARIEAANLKHIEGFTVAQWHAALGLGTRLCLDSPAALLSDEDFKDRLIQVTNTHIPHPSRR